MAERARAGPMACGTPPPNVRSEVHVHRGEPLLLWWLDDEVHTVVRVALDGERIAILQHGDESLPDDRVIVDDQNPQALAHDFTSS